MGATFSVCREGRDLLFTEENRRTWWFRTINILFCLTAVCFFLYFFLVGLDLLGSAFSILAGESSGEMFAFANNPIAGLMVGILATVLVQSSSTTTSIIVAAVASGALGVEVAIPMIFGANIGTSVTNTIVSMGFAGNVEHYERGFAGATVHDLFNLLNVAFWLPVELISNAANNNQGGLLFIISEAISDSFEVCDSNVKDCESWSGPLKAITSALTKLIINVDKDVIKDFSQGRPDADMCERLCANTKCLYKFARKACSKFPTAEPKTVCAADGSNKSTKASFRYCLQNVTAGTMEINQTVLADAQAHYDGYKINKGGVFYELGWQKEAGVVTLIISVLLLVICLVGLVKVLSYIVRGTAERMVKRALNMNGYLAILVGCGVTIFVQSSSITTSILTPLVAIGVLNIEKMLPLTLGANIGTTFTGILAALVGSSVEGFQIAMVHVLFNVFGVVMFYPIPFMRKIPVNGALALGALAARFRPFPIVYIIMVFFVYPGILLGISIGYEQGTAGAIAGATIGLLVIIALHIWAAYWYKRQGGREKIMAFIKRRNLDLRDQGEAATKESDMERGSAGSDSSDGNESRANVDESGVDISADVPSQDDDKAKTAKVTII